MVRAQVDRLGVVVSPGGESVIAGALAGAPVHLDLDAAHLGTAQCEIEQWLVSEWLMGPMEILDNDFSC